MIDTFFKFVANNIEITTGLLLSVVSSYCVYYFTKKSCTDTRSKDIEQKQLELVYYPLFLLTVQYDIINRKDNIPIFIKKSYKIIYSNQLYVTPRTMKRFKDAVKNISTGDLSDSYVKSLLWEIDHNYNYYKRSLGYPYGAARGFNENLSPAKRKILTSLISISLVAYFILLLIIIITLIN